jgi:hypothetical protein
MQGMVYSGERHGVQFRKIGAQHSQRRARRFRAGERTTQTLNEVREWPMAAIWKKPIGSHYRYARLWISSFGRALILSPARRGNWTIDHGITPGPHRERLRKARSGDDNSIPAPDAIVGAWRIQEIPPYHDVAIAFVPALRCFLRPENGSVWFCSDDTCLTAGMLP